MATQEPTKSTRIEAMLIKTTLRNYPAAAPFREAYVKMPSEQKIILDGMISQIMELHRGIWLASAIELLGVIAMFRVARGSEHQLYQEYINKETHRLKSVKIAQVMESFIDCEDFENER